MTIPSGNFESTHTVDIFPLDVRVVGPKGGGDLAPDFGACSTFTAQLAATQIPVQILQRRQMREQAWVRNTDAANAIMIAERIDKLQQAVPVGFIIPAGAEEKIESQQPYYVIALTAPVVVSVRDEGWAVENESDQATKNSTG
jgi:hypothetical protein